MTMRTSRPLKTKWTTAAAGEDDCQSEAGDNGAKPIVLGDFGVENNITEDAWHAPVVDYLDIAHGGFMCAYVDRP